MTDQEDEPPVKGERDNSPLERLLSGQMKVPKVSFPTFIDVPNITFPTIDYQLVTGLGDFETELRQLRGRVNEQAKAIVEGKAGAEQKETRIKELESDLEQLRSKEAISFLLSRVNKKAQSELLSSDRFRKKFLAADEVVAFVMSVDIRRSTELMLKARSPQAFASFITELCSDLMRVITDGYGVFDKFTGDGVLAFFPDFYSGKDAGYFVVEVADKCHQSFQRHYQKFRRSFSSILTDIGLGIGIDYGSVHLVEVAGGITVVGVPVVYACRLSGAPANTTLVNQPAYEIISDAFGSKCFIEEKTVEIKREGEMLAYEVRLNGRSHTPEVPSWE